MTNNAVSQHTSSDVAHSLRVVVTRIQRALRARVTSMVTPSQASVVARIEQVEPVRLGALAHLERVSPASMSKVVDCLEEQRLIERLADPLDGRATMVKISDEGRSLLASIRAESTTAIERALDELSAKDRLTLARSLPVLERLSEILQRDTDA